MTKARRALGKRGEELAAEHLVKSGMEVVAKNWRCRLGEIDIVAIDGFDLVIVEVKTRSSTRHGTALEAVTPDKVRRLRRLGAAWSAQSPVRFRRVRIDVAGIQIGRAGSAEIHYRRAVD